VPIPSWSNSCSACSAATKSDAAFIAATRAAGLPGVRLHDLRHAYLTKLVESDIPISLVSQMAGHATAAFTIGTYVHHDSAAAKVVADAVEGTLGRALRDL
jgi:integrase